jgi:hypothetical protein
MNEVQHFVQTIGRQNLGIGATTVFPIQGLDEEFRVKKITGACNIAAVDVLVQIRISKNSRTLSNFAVPFPDLVGTAQLPSFIENLIFPARTQVDITLTNNNAAAQIVSLTFIGEKLFK